MTNFLLPLIIEKQKVEQRLFENINLHLIPETSCINDYWISIKRTSRRVEIGYFERDGEIVKCPTKLKNDDKNILCGNNGEYNIFGSVCHQTLTTLLYLLK